LLINARHPVFEKVFSAYVKNKNLDTVVYIGVSLCVALVADLIFGNILPRPLTGVARWYVFKPKMAIF
jgi:multisubunit Na+/H+ antiporter MnhB subunit